MQPKTPRLWQAIPCTVCQKKQVTSNPTFTHDHCLAKPNPCECGKPSMPYPNCAHCKGTGLIAGQHCRHCPPGPCVTCAAKALIARAKEHREQQTS